jgi:hypothetical protein
MSNSQIRSQVCEKVCKWLGTVAIVLLMFSISHTAMQNPVVSARGGSYALFACMLATGMAIWKSPEKVVLRYTVSGIWLAMWALWWAEVGQDVWRVRYMAMIVGIPPLVLQAVWIGSNRGPGKYLSRVWRIRQAADTSETGGENDFQSIASTSGRDSKDTINSVQVCSNCGSKMSREFNFCPTCGRYVDNCLRG